MEKKYDIFISYRRDGGESTAHTIKESLSQKGYRVFYDVESMRSGKFNEQLLDTIKDCNDVLFICSPGATERCKNEGDWVRCELECAIDNKKNIIPVMTRGFQWPEPESLPPKLRELPNYQTLAANYETFDATIEKLCGYLKSKPHFMRKRVITCTVAILVLVAVFVGGWFATHQGFPSKRNEISSVQQLSTWGLTDTCVYGTAYSVFDTGMEELLKFLDKSSLQQSYYTFPEYAQEKAEQILEYKQNIQGWDQSLTECSEPVAKKIDVGNAKALPGYMTLCIQSMADDFIFLKEYYESCDGNPNMIALKKWIECCREEEALTRETVYYGFNEMFVSVDAKKPLEKIKEMLKESPQFADLYRDRGWQSNADELSGILNGIYSQSQSVVDKLNELAKLDGRIITDWNQKAAQLNDESLEPSESETAEEYLANLNEAIKQLELRRDICAFQLNDKQAAEELYGEKIADLTAQRDRLQENIEKIKELNATLEQQKSKIAALKDSAREKFKPLETDDAETLWLKALRFILLEMPEDATKCFKMYAKVDGTKEAQIYCSKAIAYVNSMEQTGVTAGVLVCAFETDLPKPDLEIGDVIYQVNGIGITSVEQAAEIRNGGNAVYKIIRFRDDGTYEKMDIAYSNKQAKVFLIALNEPQGNS